MELSEITALIENKKSTQLRKECLALLTQKYLDDCITKAKLRGYSWVRVIKSKYIPHIEPTDISIIHDHITIVLYSTESSELMVTYQLS